MATTVNFSIDYCDVADGTAYTERTAADSAECVRIVQTSWDNVREFPQAMLGSAIQAGSRIHRLTPEPHPTRPGWFCDQVDLINGAGVPFEIGDVVVFRDMVPGSADIGTAGAARWRVMFRSLPYDVVDDQNAGANPLGELCRWVERLRDFACENQTIPAGQLYIDGQPLTAPWPIPTFHEQLFYVWHQVPAIPETAISNCVGYVNNATFDGKYAAETLLCLPPKLRPIWLPNYFRGYEITYAFGYRPQGWNKFRKSDGTWGTVTRVNGGSGPYFSVGFDQLFNLF